MKKVRALIGVLGAHEKSSRKKDGSPSFSICAICITIKHQAAFLIHRISFLQGAVQEPE